MTKNEKNEIRLRIATECATVEEYDVRSALEGVSARLPIMDRFWRYLKFKPFFDFTDSLFKNEFIRAAMTILLVFGSIFSIGLDCPYAAVGNLLLAGALLVVYLVYSSHELTGIAILAYPERFKMSRRSLGGFTVSISSK